MQFLLVVLCMFSTCFVEAVPSPSRQAREFRPHFVKREEQAPLLPADNPNERIEEEYMVKLRDDLTDEELAAFEDKLQELSEERGIHVDFHHDIKQLMKGFTARIPGDALEILRWLDEVEFVEEDKEVHAVLSGSWGLDRINQANLPLDQHVGGSLGDGSGVNVYVLDTGIRFTHIEFEGRANKFIDFIRDGLDGNDCEGHGTHDAGLIGGHTVGVANGVNLYSCRVLRCDGGGPQSYMIAAMDAVAVYGKKPGVVSMSLGSPRSAYVNLAVERLVAAGFVAVAAAGNEAGHAGDYSPGSSPEAITVAATTSADKFESYSNYGPNVNILAPGTALRSAHYTSDVAYSTQSGTSMATAHVAGVAALILEQKPNLTPDEVLAALLAASTKGVCDMSVIPDRYESDTPNKLLRIPDAGF